MGVDARLFINSSWRADDIKDLLKTLPQVDKDNVKILQTHSPDYVILSFKYNDEQRELGFFYSSTYAGFTGNLLSFRTWGASKEILTTIAKRVGGFFSPQDVNDDNWERFDHPADGGLAFMVRLAVLEGKCDGSSLEQFVEHHNKTTASWKRHQERSISSLFPTKK